MSNSKNLAKIVNHYENCLEKFKDGHLSVNWNSEESANIRYKIMLECIKNSNNKTKILDFGCGNSLMYDYILKNNLQNIDYYGLDISQKFIDKAKEKFPQNSYYCVDILKENFNKKSDYVLANGVFTNKSSLEFDEMFGLFKEILPKIFNIAKTGVAFNVMSKYVDYEKDDLFHLPIERMLDFITKNLSRNFVIRSDYGLYEYTTYIYK